MGYNSRNREKGKRRGQGPSEYTDPLAVEKQKARELRKSQWWRKKISSGKCHYCGRTFHPDDLTMDHKIPLARGGLSEKINLVPACKECNNRKKNLLSVEWDEYMESIKNK